MDIIVTDRLSLDEIPDGVVVPPHVRDGLGDGYLQHNVLARRYSEWMKGIPTDAERDVRADEWYAIRNDLEGRMLALVMTRSLIQTVKDVATDDLFGILEFASTNDVSRLKRQIDYVLHHARITWNANKWTYRTRFWWKVPTRQDPTTTWPQLKIEVRPHPAYAFRWCADLKAKEIWNIERGPEWSEEWTCSVCDGRGYMSSGRDLGTHEYMPGDVCNECNGTGGRDPGRYGLEVVEGGKCVVPDCEEKCVGDQVLYCPNHDTRLLCKTCKGKKMIDQEDAEGHLYATSCPACTIPGEE